MKNLLIVFFTVWFGLGVFIVARWYRCRQSPSSGADGGGDGGGNGGDWQHCDYESFDFQIQHDAAS